MRARRLSPPQNCRVNPKTRKLLLAEANADATRAAYHAWERIQAERPLKREERTAMVAARGEMHKADKALVAARKRPIAPTTPDAYPGWTWKNHPGLVSGYFESESHSRIVPKEDLHARHFSAYTVWSPDGRDLGTRKSAALAVELADRHEASAQGASRPGARTARVNPRSRSPRVFVWPQTERAEQSPEPARSEVDAYDRVAEHNRHYGARASLQQLQAYADMRGHQLVYRVNKDRNEAVRGTDLTVLTRTYPTLTVAKYRMAPSSWVDLGQPWHVTFERTASFEDLHGPGSRTNPKAPRSPTGSKRKGPQKAKRGYQVQAFLLDADSFDLTRARAWLKMWGHKADNIRLRGPVYRAEQYPSEDFYETTLHTVGMAKHVDAVIGKPQPETDAAGAPADRRAARQQVLFPRKRSSEPKYVPDPEIGF